SHRVGQNAQGRRVQSGPPKTVHALSSIRVLQHIIPDIGIRIKRLDEKCVILCLTWMTFCTCQEELAETSKTLGASRPHFQNFYKSSENAFELVKKDF
ncbi:MAG: hypothetical protein Q3X00_06485, partial [Oscillospiraceae bacterium]|nr:hypothetical protein [Oscillospiraceae bacterium]